MENSEIEGILVSAYAFIEKNSIRGSSSVEDVMEVSPHTHSLDSVLIAIYGMRNVVGDEITKLLETRILDLRNEIDVLSFMYAADEEALSRASKAKEDITSLIRTHYT